MNEILQKIQDDVPGDMTMLTGWANPILGDDSCCGWFVCAMTPETASLLASLPENIDMPPCVSRLVMDIKELPGIRFFGIDDWYPEVSCKDDVFQEPSETVQKIRDAVDAPETRVFPVTQDEFAEVTRFHLELENIRGVRSIEILPPGKEKQDGEIRFVLRNRDGKEYGKICSPSELREIFVEPAGDRPQTGMRL